MDGRDCTRRRFLAGLALFFGGSMVLIPRDACRLLAAQGKCPGIADGKIRWIVPHAVGGGYDTISRISEPFFEEVLGREIYVENVLGAGGIVGAMTIANARPDGTTLGILNGSGLMAAALSGEEKAPSPAADFSILGRVARSRHVWSTGGNSPLSSVGDVLEEAGKRPLVFGTRDVGSISFVSITVASHLLGIGTEIVAGYSGSGTAALAALRGDVEMISVNFSSVLEQIENGDLKPLLQISDTPISSHPSLKDVPLLGGYEGLAARRAAGLGRDAAEAAADAGALSALIGSGRLIVAPPGMDPGLLTCLEEAFGRVLEDPGFRRSLAGAGIVLEGGPAAAAREDLESVTRSVDRFISLLQDSIRRIRE